MSDSDQRDLDELLESALPEFLEYARSKFHSQGKEVDFRDALFKAVSEITWRDVYSPLARDGSFLRIEIRSETVVKWRYYNKNSQQFRAGLKGRWMEANDYGGFERAKFDPEGVDCTFLGVVE